MKNITSTTVNKINQMKKIEDKTILQELVTVVWDSLLTEQGLLGASLKEIKEFGFLPVNNFDIDVIKHKYSPVEAITNGNAKYIGTHNFSFVKIQDFNGLVKQAETDDTYFKVYNY